MFSFQFYFMLTLYKCINFNIKRWLSTVLTSLYTFHLFKCSFTTSQSKQSISCHKTSTRFSFKTLTHERQMTNTIIAVPAHLSGWIYILAHAVLGSNRSRICTCPVNEAVVPNNIATSIPYPLTLSCFVSPSKPKTLCALSV